jgi:hypothetical protein
VNIGPLHGVFLATGAVAASIFEGLDVVKVLQVGATGFALLMLWYGYQAVKDVNSQTPTNDDAAQKAYARKISLTYFFLVVSLLFAALGLAGQIFLHLQQNEVVVGVTPADYLRPKLDVVHGVEHVVLNDSGRAKVLMGHGDDLSFDMTKFVVDQLSLNTGRAQTIVAGSTEGGFDDPK